MQARAADGGRPCAAVPLCGGCRSRRRRLRRRRRRGTASLGVKVPGPGRLRLRGKAVKSVERHPEAAGIISLPIRPRYRTRRVLDLEGKARVRVRVTYEPTNGGPHTKTKRIELRKRR